MTVLLFEEENIPNAALNTLYVEILDQNIAPQTGNSN
jgi:hypothetical protein